MAARQIAIDALPIAPVNPNTPVPLYHQVEMHLRKLIASGLLLPDDLLPPENELSKRYDVGRHTMRMAMSRLVADGILERQAGYGTTVKTQVDRTRFYLDRSFTQQMVDMGMQAKSRVLQTDFGIIDETSPPPLQVNRGAPYFHLVRLRFGDDFPIGVQSTTIITEHCPNLQTFDFNNHSLYEVLSNTYKLHISQISHAVSAVNAGRTDSDLLGVPSGDPLLIVKTSAYLEDQEIIEYTYSQYRADRYEYHTMHTFVR
jgi:GntR family transcriptional regulator